MTRISDAGQLVVIGSINYDHFLYVEEFPSPGETIKATESRQSIGGKGANQAASAARLGAKTYMLGSLGGDEAGVQARKVLVEAGVDTSGVVVFPGRSTGTAFITVSASGENSIIIDAGANSALGADRVSKILQSQSADTVVLTQGELTAEVIERAGAATTDLGLRFVLNLAPARPLPEITIAGADPLIVNEHEARAIGLSPSADDIDSWKEAVAANVGRLAKSIVVTLGGRGAVAGDETATRAYPSPPVDVKDTSGAGDAVCGTVAAFLSRGHSFVEAIQAGVAAGAFSVRSSGTIESYPTANELALHLSVQQQHLQLRT